jgi:hypothetical protein
MNKTINTILGVLTLAAMPAVGVPSGINYQAALTDDQGNPVTGTREMSIKLYDAATGGTLLYSEDIGTVDVSDGVFSFEFGTSGSSNAQQTDTVAITDGTATTFQKVLSASEVVAGSVSVTDGTYTWSQSGGSSNEDEFGVAYSTSLRRVTVTYFNGAPAAGRTITATYRTPASGISGALAGDNQPWAEITMDGVAQVPRQKVLTVPFAASAGLAQRVIEQPMLAPGSVGIDSLNVTELDSRYALLDRLQILEAAALARDIEAASYEGGNRQAADEIFWETFKSSSGANNTVVAITRGAFFKDKIRALNTDGLTDDVGRSSNTFSPAMITIAVPNRLVAYASVDARTDAGGHNLQIRFVYADNTSQIVALGGTGPDWGTRSPLNPLPSKEVKRVEFGTTTAGTSPSSTLNLRNALVAAAGTSTVQLDLRGKLNQLPTTFRLMIRGDRESGDSVTYDITDGSSQGLTGLVPGTLYEWPSSEPPSQLTLKLTPSQSSSHPENTSLSTVLFMPVPR